MKGVTAIDRRPKVLEAQKVSFLAHQYGMAVKEAHTTKMMPSSLTHVQRSVCCSVLYGGLLAAELLDFSAPDILFSSTNTSVMKLLITEGLTGAHLRDHTTTPEVVTISNVSSIAIVEVLTMTVPSSVKNRAGLSSAR